MDGEASSMAACFSVVFFDDDIGADFVLFVPCFVCDLVKDDEMRHIIDIHRMILSFRRIDSLPRLSTVRRWDSTRNLGLVKERAVN